MVGRKKKHCGGRIYVCIIVVGANQLNGQKLNLWRGVLLCVCVRDKCRQKTEILYRQQYSRTMRNPPYSKSINVSDGNNYYWTWRGILYRYTYYYYLSISIYFILGPILKPDIMLYIGTDVRGWKKKTRVRGRKTPDIFQSISISNASLTLNKKQNREDFSNVLLSLLCRHNVPRWTGRYVASDYFPRSRKCGART